MALLILAADDRLLKQPSRHELGPRRATLNFTPVALAPEGFAPFRLAGAWAVNSDDPRLGGVSALALDGERFIALTDSGVLIRFGRPRAGRATALIAELPGGPGRPIYKFNRDSEAVVRDPLGRGWWVGFENRNEVWLYDAGFDRALGRIVFGKRFWPRNLGLEGLATAGRDLLLFPETGRTVIRWSTGDASSHPIDRPLGRVSDAIRLPGGGLVVLHRDWTALGFANAITVLEPTASGGWGTARSISLGVSRSDNVEAMAAERLPDGGTRLWMMTDDNLQRPLRTLLLALDVPRGWAG